jgi:hypothetical protein
MTAVGPLLASLAWIWADASSTGPSTLASLQAEFSQAVARPRHVAPARSSFTSQLMIRPLFQSAPGGSGVEPNLRLEGLAKTSQQTAALIAIGDQAPQWLEMGETRSGVTLRAIAADGATVETIGGAKTLKLGKAPAQTAANPAPPMASPHPAPPSPSR